MRENTIPKWKNTISKNGRGVASGGEDPTRDWLLIILASAVTPAFFRFPTSLFVIRRFPLVSRPVSLSHNLTVSPQSQFDAQKAHFGILAKSLSTL